MTTTKMPPCVCPICLYSLTAATGSPGTSPEEDDLSLCFNCGALLIFNEDLVLEIPSGEVLETLSEEEKEEIRKIQDLIGELKDKHQK